MTPPRVVTAAAPDGYLVHPWTYGPAVRLRAWVTLLSRSDPGLPILFAGAAALCAPLAVGFWLPRRRVTVRHRGAVTELLRGERFDRPTDELDGLLRRLAAPA